MIGAVLRGAWLGFCIAAPVGPIGVLVMKRSLQAGRRAGLASGLGAALADLVYGILAVAGVRLAAGYGRTVAVAGGCVLLWLAWKSWGEQPAALHDAGPVGGTAATFLLTLSNPMTILSFAAMVAGNGAEAPAAFVAGVFSGSMLWWMILSWAAERAGTLLKARGLVLNRLSALTLASFGLWAIWIRGR